MAKKTLVVDDESLIASNLARFLTSQGYEAASFPDALSCVSSLPCTGVCPSEQPCAHAIITDLCMPGMTGLNLLELLSARKCKVPHMAIMSASGRDVIPRAMDKGYAFFEKPLELPDILSWLRQDGEHGLIPVEG